MRELNKYELHKIVKDNMERFMKLDDREKTKKQICIDNSKDALRLLEKVK